jgi:hypothetical protein
MPTPTDVAGVKRLCGMVQYMAKFLPDLANEMEPIRELTRKEVSWNWSNERERAFQKVKKRLIRILVKAFEFIQHGQCFFLYLRPVSFKNATEKDASLQSVTELILNGWPEDKDRVPNSALPFFNIRVQIHDSRIEDHCHSLQ